MLDQNSIEVEVGHFVPQNKQVTDIFVKKMSNTVLQHTYNPNADYDWIQTQSNLPYCPLDIELPVLDIIEELANLEEWLTDYDMPERNVIGWRGFGIFAPGFEYRGDSHADTIPNATWTPEAEMLMPKTVDFFKNHFPCKTFRRIRVLELAPGGSIGLHTDNVRTLGSVNMAIVHPEHCNFYIKDGGVIPFKNGKSFAVNIGFPHAVINHSMFTRWHITLNYLEDDRWKELLVRSYHAHFGK